MIVNRRVFFNVRIATGHIGFWLIVIVIGNEILDGVVRKKVPHFRIQLRGQRFVGGEHQTRPSGVSDDVSYRVGFPRPGDTKQGLVGLTIVQPPE